MIEPRTGRLVLLAIWLFVVVTRLSWAVYIQNREPGVSLTYDSKSYTGSALALARSHRFLEAPDSLEPEFVRTPGYPLFIAVCYRLFGEHQAPVVYLQVIVCSLTVPLAYAMGRALCSVATGLGAAALLAVDPLQFQYAGMVLTEALFTVAFTLVGLAAIKVFHRESHRTVAWAVVLGGSLAWAALIRPVAYYVPLIVIAALVSAAIARGWSSSKFGSTLLALLVPLVVLVGGWQLRNSQVVGSWRLSGIESLSMYRYRAAAVVAMRDHVDIKQARETLVLRLPPELRAAARSRWSPEVEEASGLSQGAFYELLYREGVAVLRKQPNALVRVTLRGLVAELGAVGRGGLFRYLRVKPDPRIKTLFRIVLAMSYLLAVLGSAALIRRHRATSAANVVVLCIVCFVLLLSAGPESHARFRAPVAPILYVYVAAGLTVTARVLRSR